MLAAQDGLIRSVVLPELFISHPIVFRCIGLPSQSCVYAKANKGKKTFLLINSSKIYPYTPFKELQHMFGYPDGVRFSWVSSPGLINIVLFVSLLWYTCCVYIAGVFFNCLKLS